MVEWSFMSGALASGDTTVVHYLSGKYNTASKSEERVALEASPGATAPPIPSAWRRAG